MQLNEIIEENTLPTISRRTRIPLENLEAIVHRDWPRLQKVQALGFLSILEREYHVDLSDLKADCRAYYAELGPVEEKEPLIVPPTEREENGRWLRIALLLLLLIAAYGSWKYLESPKAAEENGTRTVPVKKEGSFFDSVLSMTKGWFGENNRSAAEEEIAPAEVPVAQGAWAEANGSEKNRTVSDAASLQSPLSKEKNTVKDSNTAAATAGAGEEKDEAKIITQVKKEQAKAEELRRQSVQEPAVRPTEENLSDLSRMILAATAAGTPAPSGGEKALAPTVPSREQEQSTGASAVATDRDKKEEPPVAAPTTQKQKPAVTDMLVIFHPRSKVWYGYTDLRTMKRAAGVTAEDITFDTSKGDYILATGHGKVEFRGKNSLKLKDGSRHFFMIAQGGVREISHEEFQRLNKSKVW